MMLDPHVKFAKSIGVKDTKICPALMQQLEKHDRNFENCQELLNAILDQEDKCMKCMSNKKNAVDMPCQHIIYYWTCLQDMHFCWLCSQQLIEKIRVYKALNFFSFLWL